MSTTIAPPMLMELEHEMANTRKTLERVDDSKLDWQPHEKSMTYGRLASHIAEVPSWMATIINDDVFEVTSDMEPFNAKTKAEILETFDTGLAAAKEALAAATDEQMMGMWTMKVDGQVTIEMPRVAVVRAWIFSHTIHHRGQFTVYLRETGGKVPALYGPSADEQE